MNLIRNFVVVWLPFAVVSLGFTSVHFADDTTIATFDTAWDALFTRNDGWTGGDVAGTIDLKVGRVLWVFGDSWIGRVEGGKHLPGSQLINNTAAIQDYDASSLDRPPRSLRFLVGRPTDKGIPTAWITPPLKASGGRKPPDSSNPDSSKSDSSNPLEDAEKTWYWASGGGITIVRSGRPSLYVFLFRVQKGAGNDGVWNFRIVGTTMAIFDDIRLPTEDWQPRLIDIPHSIDGPGDPKPNDAKWLAWGIAALTESSSIHDDVLIYGVRRESNWRNDLLVAKVPYDEIEKFDRWRFFVEPNQWSEQLDKARPVAENIPTELSVERTRDGSKYLMIHSEPILGPGIFLRKSERPEGPWSKPQLVHRVTDKEGDRRFYAYAAKGHALLSGTDELLVTYVVNSHEFPLMFQDASIYRPRCLRVKLAQ